MLSTVFFPTFLFAKNINFVINIPFITPDHSSIYLTGNIPGFCLWQPDCIKLKAIGVGSYGVSLSIPDEVKKIDYKITRGSWENEAADSNSKSYSNFSSSIENPEIPIVQTIIHWKDLSALSKTSNVLGPYYLYSEELKANKELSIYLPPTYFTSSKFYPVIYMHDGQNVFDPKSSSYGEEWSIDETMNKLISNHEINEAIIVAIHTNNVDREYEYDYFLKGKQYSHFIINSVIPFVEKNFRVISNKNSRFMMGSSMGALISLMMIIDRPDLFSKVAGLSIPANIDNRAIFRFLNEKRKLAPFGFYMDHGNWGHDANYGPLALELYDQLIAKGIDRNHLNYLIFPFADHREADWARRAYIPLKFLLNN